MKDKEGRHAERDPRERDYRQRMRDDEKQRDRYDNRPPLPQLTPPPPPPRPKWWPEPVMPEPPAYPETPASPFKDVK